MYVHVIRQYSRYVIRCALRVIKLHRAQGHTVHPNWKGTEYTCPVQQHLFDATVIFSSQYAEDKVPRLGTR